MEVVWKYIGYKADPQKCYDEICSLGESVTPQEIVAAARDKNSELHKCFEWDDTRAAEMWRIQQARQIVCNLVVVHTDEQTKHTTKFRVIQHTASEAYKPVTLIMKDKEKYAELLRQCRIELQNIKRRYESVVEYEQIWELID